MFWRCHVDHIKHRHVTESVIPTENDRSVTLEDILPENSAGDISNEKKVAEKLLSPDSMLLPSHQAVQASDEPVVPVVVEHDHGKAGSSKSTTTTPKTVTLHDMHSQQPRYPLRQRKPPDYYGRGKQT